MPTYEYACASCGEHVEVVQSFSDDPLTTCPSCGGTLRKVFGTVGIVLKGSGFYRTDSRSTSGKGRPAKTEKETSGTSASDGSADSTSSSSTTGTGSSEKAAPAPSSPSAAAS